jgi:signal peptidase II
MTETPAERDENDSNPLQSVERSYFSTALIIAAVIAVSDQLTKLWVLDLLADGQPSVSVIGDFFRLTLVYNYGGALGTNFGSPTVYLIMGLLIFSGLLYYLWTSRHIRWFALTLGLIAGGAIGNLTDRVRLGKVVDWIDVDIPDVSLLGYELHRFWTFNLADSAITVSLAFLLWKYLHLRPHIDPADNSTEEIQTPGPTQQNEANL